MTVGYKHNQVKPGDRFGMLTVIERATPIGAKIGGIQWTCRCDCGELTTKRGSHMVSGKVSACGCLMKGAGKGRGTYSPEEATRAAFQSMGERCRPSSKDAEHYHQRGIGVCPRWTGSGAFERFVSDVGIRPRSDLSLDRIDNDRGYEPGNVRWTTYHVQALNTQRITNPMAKDYGNALHRVVELELENETLRELADTLRRIPELELENDRLRELARRIAGI